MAEYSVSACCLIAVLGVRAHAAATVNNSISYTFTPVSWNDHALQVELTFEAGSRNQTAIALPRGWETEQDVYLQIQHMKAVTPRVEVVDTADKMTKLVKHPAEGEVTLQYELVSDVKAEIPRKAEYDRPIINGRYFYLIGNSSLVLPGFSEKKQHKFVVRWANFPPNWAIANRFGVNQTSPQSFQGTLETLRKSTFMGGDFRIHNLDSAPYTLWLATRGDWLFADNRIEQMVMAIAREETRIFGGFRPPRLLIAVLPISEEGFWGGESRTSSVSMYIPSQVEDPGRFARTLAHEMFHAWSLHGLNCFDERLYWFSEGFAEYYGMVIPLRLGMLSFQDFVAAYNQIARDYFGSAASNLTADQMMVARKPNRETKDRPYRKGSCWRSTGTAQ